MAMFNTLNRQQQPFIQSGYGAMSKLNTLLGLGGSGGSAPGGAAPMSPPSTYRPTPGGGMQQVVGPASAPQGIDQGMRLKQLLALRAQNGDTEAARILGQI